MKQEKRRQLAKIAYLYYEEGKAKLRLLLRQEFIERQSVEC